MKAVNAENEAFARRVRERLAEAGVLMINLMSGPGAGKTTLLEKTLGRLGDRYRFAAIEGDLFTDRDARRLERFHIPVIQLNTQGSCHLTAQMIEAAIEKMPLAGLDFLLVENVGNLVCPSSFNLGEQRRVTLLSISEGSDKIAKYPKAFRTADCLVVTKLDLLPATDFSLAEVAADFRVVNAHSPILALSAKTGEGMTQWYQMLKTWKAEEDARPRVA
ncbi:MAG: hydrogenase nickel incorporation protein HypB [Armatimonadetes bacterium]|nr:hydrogenase nickel incorporation protein HypB [Armatimonadota bacterium]